MRNILDEIAEYARERVKSAKQRLPLEAVREQALSLTQGETR